MVRRTTWILVLVFAALVGFAWWFQKYQATKTEDTATSTPTAAPAYLYDLGNKQISQINITDNAGNKIDLNRDATTAEWGITGTPMDQADSSKIQSLSSQLTAVQIMDTLPQDPPLDSVGLATPAYTITMTSTDGMQLVTYVGAPTAIGSGYYVKVGSRPVVIVAKTALDKFLDLLKNPPLLPTATPSETETGIPVPTDLGAQSTPTP